FGYEWGKKLRCVSHILKGMKDAKSARCIECLNQVLQIDALIISAKYKSEKLCIYHGMIKEGKTPHQRIEKIVVEYIKERFGSEYSIVYNSIDPEDLEKCSKRRADFIISA